MHHPPLPASSPPEESPETSVHQLADHLFRHESGKMVAILSEYHLEAAIAACHSTATEAAATDWPRILSLYDRLLQLTASPVAAMNRAVAVARVHGPRTALDALDAIPDRAAIETHHLYQAIRGTLAAELGDLPRARTHFRRAADLATLPAERDFIARRLSECGAG